MSEDNAAEPAATPETGIPAAPESLLDSSTPELSKGEWFQSEGVKGMGDSPEWYQHSHFKNVNEQARAYGELQSKFGGFVGAPKDGYATPEGIDKEDALLVTLTEFGNKFNMNQEGMTAAWDMLTAQETASSEAFHETEMAKLGDNHDQRIKRVENALKHKLGDNYEDVSKLVNSADSIMLVESMLKAFSPAVLPKDGGENPTGVTWEKIESLMFETNEAGQMRCSVEPEFNAMVLRMQEEWGGNGPDISTVS